MLYNKLYVAQKILCCSTKLNYSGGSNTERSKSEPIRNPNLFLFRFRMVLFSNGRSVLKRSDFEQLLCRIVAQKLNAKAAILFSPFENRTIQHPNDFGPFEFRTRSVFEPPLQSPLVLLLSNLVLFAPMEIYVTIDLANDGSKLNLNLLIKLRIDFIVSEDFGWH